MTDPREKKYECSWCRQRFYTEHYMQSHMQKLHRKSVQHQCQLCSQRFTLLTCLSIHTAKVHSSSNNNNNNNPSSSINNNNNNNNNNNTKNYIDDDDDGCNNFVDVGKGGFEKKETERQRVSGEKRENSNEEGGGKEGLNHRERKRRTRMEKRKKRRRYNEAEDSDGGDQVTLASLITQRDSNHKNKPITNTTTTTTLTHDDYDDDDAIDKETGVHKETLEHMMCKLIDGVKYWICKVCHNAKLCCTKMAIHVETKHLNAPERSKRHVCEVCGKRFRIPKSLRTHMTVHDDVPPLNFRCKYCPAAYRSRSTLDEHIAKKHEGSSRLCCMLCGFCCNVYIQLMRHMRYEHAF